MTALLDPPRAPAPPTEPSRRGSSPAGVGQGTDAPASRPQRDAFVDAVRALATLSVLTVHWLMADATWDGETLRIGNALVHGAGWAVTWLLQVLALLFFAAGASAAYGLVRRPDDVPAARRGGPSDVLGRGVLGAVGADLADGWRLVLHRLRRLLRPVGVFAVAWVVAIVVLLVGGLPGGAVRALATLAPQLLWFLAIYLVLLALTPLLRRALHAAGWWGVALLTAAPLAVEALRFGAGLERLALVDVVLVWAVPYAIGLLYADVRSGIRVLRRGRVVPVAVLPSRAVLVGVGLAAAAFAALLVALGPYPASLIGMPGDTMSNLGPPTAPVVLHAVALVAFALASRDLLARWAHGRGRKVVAGLAARSMTVYLWHVTAMIVVVAVVLVGLGERLPDPGSADWWASRPVWFGAFALVLLGISRVVGRFESPRRRSVPAVGLSARGRGRSTAGGAASAPAAGPRHPLRVPSSSPGSVAR
ncbi:acyltransferase family protein [Cellulosimicrobium terreum]|nr:acyltransferase family protein [Cellulosimicrobium terreum]